MNARTLLLLIVTWVAFGSVFLAIKVGVGYCPPLLLAMFRFVPAGVILYLLAIRLSNGTPDPIGPRQLIFSAIIGVSMAFVNGVVTMASTVMDSWIVSVLTCTIPLWSYAVAVLFAHRPLRVVELLGVICGFGGIVVLLWPSANEAVHISLLFSCLILAGAAVWGATSVWEKSAPIPKRPLVAMGLQMIFCGITFAIWSAVAGEYHSVTASILAPQSIAAIFYLIFIASVLGYGAYMALLVSSGPTVGNSFGYVAPAIAVLLGWAILHEPVTLRTFGGFALIVVAVLLIVAPPPLPHRIH